uniref:Replicase protein n=1 Tax=Myzus persicae nege-like virus 1 TaxID=2961857 RepID=A0A976X7E5_9VIRU|nr:replicase protein [Myzus persicae nege-like virus 1]
MESCDNITELLPALGTTTDEAVQRVLRNVVTSQNSVCASLLEKGIANRATNIIDNRKKLPEVNLKAKHTPDEEAALQTAFPEFYLKFSPSTAHTHAYAYSSRLLETLQLLSEHGYDPSQQPGTGYNDVICDFGGNYFTHVSRGRSHIHSCCPVLDWYDSGRDLRREMQLSTLKNSANSEKLLPLIHSALDEHQNVVRCYAKAQDCKRTAMRAIMVHSSYDMTLKDIANAMARKGTLLLLGTFIYVPEVMTSTYSNGSIPILNAHYSIDKPSGTIHFSFENDPSFNYIHRLDSYLGIALNSLIKSDCGKVYSIELGTNRNGIQFYSITRCLRPPMYMAPLVHTSWLPSLKGKTIVGYFTWDMSLAKNESTLKPLKRISIIAPTVLVDSILQYAVKSDEKTFNMKDLFSFATSVNTRQICNGKDVTSPERLKTMDLYYISHAIYIYAYAEKWKGGITDKKLLECERFRREYAKNNLIKKFFSSLFCDRSFLMNFIKVGDWDCFDKIHTWLYHWRTAPEEYGVRIEDATWFSTHESVIKSYKVNRDHIRDIRDAIAEGNVSFADDDRTTLLSSIKTQTRKVLADIINESAAPVESLTDPPTDNTETVDLGVKINPINSPSTLPFSRSNSLSCRSSSSNSINSNQDSVISTANPFYKCSLQDDLTPIKTLGDGNCFLYAVNTVYTLPEASLEIIKREMFNHYASQLKQEGQIVNQELFKFLNHNYIPADDTVIELYANTFNVTVCVHYACGDLCTRHGNSSGKTVHILYHKPLAGDVGHFEGLRLMERHESILKLPSTIESLTTSAKNKKLQYDNTDDSRRRAFHPLSQAMDYDIHSDYYLAAELLHHTPPTTKILFANFQTMIFPSVVLTRGFTVNVIPHDDFFISDHHYDSSVNILNRHEVPRSDVIYLDVRAQSMVSESSLTKKCFKNFIEYIHNACSPTSALILLTDMLHVRENVDTYVSLFSMYKGTELISPLAENPCETSLIIRFSGRYLTEIDTQGFSVMRSLLNEYHDRLTTQLKNFSEFTGTRQETPSYPYWMMHAREGYNYTSGFGSRSTLSETSATSTPLIDTVSHDYNSTIDKSVNIRKTSNTTTSREILTVDAQSTISSTDHASNDTVSVQNIFDASISISRVLIRDNMNIKILCDRSNIEHLRPCTLWTSSPFSNPEVVHCNAECTTSEAVRAIFVSSPLVYLTVPNSAIVKSFLDNTKYLSVTSNARPNHYILIVRTDDASVRSAFHACMLGRKGVSVQPLSINLVLHHLVNFSPALENSVVEVVSNDSPLCISPNIRELQWKFSPHMHLDMASLQEKKSIALTFNTLRNLLTTLNNNEKTVLCHCASKNLNDSRRMTRGVAKQIVSIYGIPNSSNRLENLPNLLVQDISESFKVVTLLTKEEFNSKPIHDNFKNYKTAINQFFQYCCQQNFSRIITVPLGVGLDKVTPKFFLDCINSSVKLCVSDFRLQIITNSYPEFSSLKTILQGGVSDMVGIDTISNSTVHLNTRRDALSKPYPHYPKSKIEIDKTNIQDAWNDSETIRNEWACFRPDIDYSPTPKAYFSNAIKEQLELWRVHDATLQLTYKNLYQSMIACIGSRDKHAPILRDAKDYGLLCNRTGTFVIKPKHNRTYTHGFDGSRFVSLDVDKSDARNKRTQGSKVILRSIHTKADYLMVSRDTELMNDLILYERCKNVDLRNFSLPDLKFIQGVPGCGKTHYIIHNHKISDNKSDNDLVLTTTREGAADLLKRVQEINADASKDNYSTSHSYIINRRTPARTVWIDEALMKHAGEIFLVAYFSRCTTMHLLGDTAQIPYINRIAHASTRFADPTTIIKDVTYLNHSYRCPGDVAAVLGSRYKQGMTSQSCLINTTSLRLIRNIKDVSHHKDVQYLVFKQEEKETMLRAGFLTSTIHEFQGKQADHVVIVRLSRYERENIYLSKPHALVALSRHRKSLTYYTLYDSDALSQLILECQKVTKPPAHEKRILAGGIPHAGTSLLLKTTRPSSRQFSSNKPHVFLPYLRSEAYTYDDISLTPHTVNPFPMRAGVVGDLLHANCVTSDERPLVPYFPFTHTDAETEDHNEPEKISHPSTGNITDLQIWYDAMLPGCSTHYMEYDQQIVESTDRELIVDRVSFDTIAHKNSKAPRPALSPRLRTAMYNNRVPSQLESLLAMIKRNFNVPDLNGVVDNEMISDLMVERFINTFIPEANRTVFNALETEKIGINSASIQSWLRTQPSSTIGQIKPQEAYWNTTLNTYHFMNKKSVKPALEINAPFSYPALQTIAFHDKNINAIFCPVFRDLKERLLALIDKRFLLFCDVSPDDFVRTLNKRFDPACLDYCEKLEIDISKYDKSQGELMYLFENKIYRLLGMDHSLNSAWMAAHKETRLKDYAHRVTAYVDYQRKSGDASTYFGNTVVLMGIISTLYDITGCTMGLFSGDDSLLVGGDIHEDRNFMCANLFNLESKMFKYRDSYFCSKFLLNVDGFFRLIPDPLKVVTKLGRRDLVDYVHVNEYRTSYCDLLKDYEDITICDVLNRAINERYRNNIHDHSFALAAIYNLVSDEKKFSELYYIAEGTILIDDPSRPKLD